MLFGEQVKEWLNVHCVCSVRIVILLFVAGILCRREHHTEALASVFIRNNLQVSYKQLHENETIIPPHLSHTNFDSNLPEPK